MRVISYLMTFNAGISTVFVAANMDKQDIDGVAVHMATLALSLFVAYVFARWARHGIRA